jgi:hypothetical protein
MFPLGTVTIGHELDAHAFEQQKLPQQVAPVVQDPPSLVQIDATQIEPEQSPEQQVPPVEQEPPLAVQDDTEHCWVEP